jgi:hypothetical protein
MNELCSNDARSIQAFAKLLEERSVVGWQPFLLTFLFTPISGSHKTKMRVMVNAVERFYATLLTRVVRKPLSPQSRDRLPLLLCAPDFPVAKRNKGTNSVSRDTHINDGLHWHGLLMVPPRSRLKEDFASYLVKNELHYRNDLSRLLGLHVEPIVYGFDRIVDYVFKGVLSGKFSFDDFLVLPKSQKEF